MKIETVKQSRYQLECLVWNVYEIYYLHLQKYVYLINLFVFTIINVQPIQHHI